MTSKILPLMQSVLNENLKNHPEKDPIKEEKTASLGQELLDNLWVPQEKPTTFWPKLKFALLDGINLPQKLFDRIIDFRVRQGLAYEKEKMQDVMFYATKSFCKGTEILGRGCYLFRHNPQAFEKYATSFSDFLEDIHQSKYDEDNVFIPNLGVDPIGIPMVAAQSEQEECRAEERRVPLLSFAPIKYGKHPTQISSQKLIGRYEGLFSDVALQGFQYDPYCYESLKKLLCTEYPESRYPATHHKAIAIALNEFNRRLEKEPVKICAHKSNQNKAETQHIKE